LYFAKAHFNLKKFTFPSNAWVGVSSPPDYMSGHKLPMVHKIHRAHETMKALADLKTAGKATTTWMSMEPMSSDYSGIIDQYPGVLDWVVIGAASDGSRHFPPEQKHVENMLNVLDMQGVPVFYKGNLRSLTTLKVWREEFPQPKL
jgi:hypothetical protein